MPHPYEEKTRRPHAKKRRAAATKARGRRKAAPTEANGNTRTDLKVGHYKGGREGEIRNAKTEIRATEGRSASEGDPYKSKEKSRNWKIEIRKWEIAKPKTRRPHATKRRAAATKKREKRRNWKIEIRKWGRGKPKSPPEKNQRGATKEKSRKSKCENGNSKMGKRETQEPTRKKPAWGNQREKPKVEMRKWKFENGEEGNPRHDARTPKCGERPLQKQENLAKSAKIGEPIFAFYRSRVSFFSDILPR